jgi:hypothetical protein
MHLNSYFAPFKGRPMYDKAQAAQTRQAFWTAFGQYMAPQPSAGGERINWVNYKTGEKGIRFRMQAGTRTASIEIELSHSDTGMQQLYFEQFEQLRAVLHGIVEENWQWQLHTQDENAKTISRIYTKLDGVNIMNRSDWPTLISFFKPRLIALDQFWSDVKHLFEALR